MYRQPLVRGISQCLQSLSQVADPGGRKVAWTPLAAARAAVLMHLDDSATLRTRCREAMGCLGLEAGGRVPGRTYNGLVKALDRQSGAVWSVLKADLRRQAAGVLAGLKRTRGFRLLAVDGTKIELPRTGGNEDRFGIADNGESPQAFVTAIVEVRTLLPWDWRVDRGDASEKLHLPEMVADLPEGSLLLADGNFTGYPLWSRMIEGQRDFLIRVGGNVRLLHCLFPEARIERRGDIVYAWPKKRRSDHPPLRLRLITLGEGASTMYLLTSVLSRKRLPDAAAGEIYGMRWGVETFYRGFKRVLGHVKCKSRSGRRSEMELEWSLLSCWVMLLLGVAAIRNCRGDPCQISLAGVAHCLREHLRHGTRGELARRRFYAALAACLKDNYVRLRSKSSRHRPRTRNTPRHQYLKPPKILHATPQEQNQARKQHPSMII